MPGHLNRDRVRDYLVAAGPVEEASGQATAILRSAIDYGGSDVGFSQLLSAMEQRGEIERDIRGKRTYRIAAVSRAGAGSGDGAREGRHAVGVSAQAGEAALQRGAHAAPSDIDYEALAAALLTRVADVLAGGTPADRPAGALLADLQRLTEERDQLQAKVAEIEDRLARADRNTAILLQMMRPAQAQESVGALTPGPAAGRELIEVLLSALARPDDSARAS